MTKPFNNIINNNTTSYITAMQLDNDNHDNELIGSASEFIKGKNNFFSVLLLS
jgi:hypothetical protein